MNPIVKAIVRDVKCLRGDDLRAVIDALVEVFERRKAERLSRLEAPDPPEVPAV